MQCCSVDAENKDLAPNFLQMAELNAHLKHEETRVSLERAQHNAAAKDLMLAQEEVLELRRRVRVAVCLSSRSASYHSLSHLDPARGI